MRARGNALPPVKIDAEEDRFGKEGEAFQRKGHTYDRAGVAHEARPEQTQFKRKNGARNRPDRDPDRSPFGPALRKLQVNLFTGSQPTPLGDDHQEWHRNTD